MPRSNSSETELKPSEDSSQSRLLSFTSVCTAMHLIGHGYTVPELIVATANAGNYNYEPFDAAGYMGPDTFTIDKYHGNCRTSYIRYLLVTRDK